MQSNDTYTKTVTQETENHFCFIKSLNNLQEPVIAINPRN